MTSVRRSRTLAHFALSLVLLAGNAVAVEEFTGNPRLIVLTDIGNEPDDQMSFVRLLLYSNEIDIEGVVATTSTWQKEKLQPQTLREVIAAYGAVRRNLLRHARGWPTAAVLTAKVSAGQPGYGMAAVGPDKLSPGAANLIRAADRDDPRPLFVSVWGGANTLAQALLQVRATRSSTELLKFMQKLRVYSISDQDDAGPWIRREFPELHYVVRPTSPDGAEYVYATWTGISGDVYYRNCDGADPTTVTYEWLDANIRGKGALGQRYPKFLFIMEGDTPAFLGLTRNGLESFRSPAWGGWGGRYLLLKPHGETRMIWTQGGDLFGRVTSQDAVPGVDGRVRISDQATIWRWRGAYQHDFAARMDWTVKPYKEANHHPTLTVNGVSGTTTIFLDARVGAPVELDASRSADPDGHALTWRWFHYAEAGFGDAPGLSDMRIAGANTPKATVTPVATCRPAWLASGKPCAEGVAHVILEVTDDGTPALTSYRRVILRVRAQ